MFITGSGGNGLAQVSGRQVRAGSERRFAGGGEAVSGVRLGDRAGRPGRQDHHLQERPGDRPQEEDPVDERQVRRRHRRGHRQDQRQAAHPRRAALPDGLQGRQAASGGRQVRRLRRDRYQRPAEDGRAARRADGVAVRSHRHAEPLGADARQHAAAGGAAAGRPQLLHQGHARLLEAQHSQDLGGAQYAAARGRAARRPDQDARQRAVLRRHRLGGIRQDAKTTASASISATKSWSGTSNVGRDEEKAKRGGAGGLAKDDGRAGRIQAEVPAPRSSRPTTFQPGEVVEGFVGIDGGSTSTKAVLLSKDHKRRILAKTYQLSKGNPIEDTIEVLQKLDDADSRPGRGAEDSGRRHHRLCQGHSEGRDRRRCRAGRDRGAHRSRRCTSTTTWT